MKNQYKKFVVGFWISLSLSLFSIQLNAQLLVTPGGDPTYLVNNVLLGYGVTAMDVTFNGGPLAYGTFNTGVNPTNIGLTSGIILTTGLATNAIGPNTSGGLGTDLHLPGDSLLTAWGGQQTFDANILEFNFIPQGDTIKFRYVFGSEEYPEYVTNLMNDIFGFFISVGPDPDTYLPMEDKNIALVPGTNLAVSIHNINNVIPSYAEYYVDNTNGVTIQYDGFTTVLTAWCRVVPCFMYHMKLAIADGGDGVWDSGVFLEAGSFTSGGIQTTITYTNPQVSNTTAIEGCNDAILTIKMPHIMQDSFAIPYSILASSTATYGVDYDPIPVNLIIPAGSDSVNIIIHALLDTIPEGTETVGIVIPNTICLTSTDTVYFTIVDYVPVEGTSTYSDTSVQCGTQLVLNSYASQGLEPYQFNWSNGSTFDTANINPTITTLYYLTITDACGYTVHDSTLVNIFGPFANAGADTTICTGGTAILHASGGNTYAWSNGMNTQTISVSPTVNTSYIVTVTDVCSDVDTVRVLVNPLPVVTAVTSADSLCPGEAAHLTAGGATTYVWSSNPADPSLSGQTTLVNPLVTPVSSVLYTVVGTDANTCVNTASVMVVVKPVPNANFIIDDYGLCVNETTNITYTGNAPPNATFTWNFSGGDVINGSGIGPYEVAWNDPGQPVISLLVNRDGCLSPVNTDSVTVISRPTALFDVDVTEGCAPLEVHFNEYSLSVLPGSVYQWYFGNGEGTLIQNPVYIYNKSGSFSVTLIVSNQYGCNDTLIKNALIHVYPNPEAAFSFHPQRVSLLDPVVKFYDNSFGQIENWQWNFGDGSSGNLPNLIHTYADTGTYQVVLTVSTMHNCIDSTYGEVVVTPDNTIFIPNAFSPNHDGRNDIFQAFGTNIIEFHMDIYTRWGELIFTSDNIDNGWDGTYKGDIVKTGVYDVIIRYRDYDGNRHSYYGRVTVLR